MKKFGERTLFGSVSHSVSAIVEFDENEDVVVDGAPQIKNGFAVCDFYRKGKTIVVKNMRQYYTGSQLFTTEAHVAASDGVRKGLLNWYDKFPVMPENADELEVGKTYKFYAKGAFAPLVPLGWAAVQVSPQAMCRWAIMPINDPRVGAEIDLNF